MEKSIIGTTEITSNFQITVIKKVRKQLDVKTGDTLVFYGEKGKITIER